MPCLGLEVLLSEARTFAGRVALDDWIRLGLTREEAARFIGIRRAR